MRLKNLINSAYAVFFACMLWSCDTVKEEDRFIYVKPAEVNRSVLIEDFTGQNCVNCPAASKEIEKLQEEYGKDVIIAVGIHSGPFGHRTTMSSPRLPLCTETGDDYFLRWKIEYQPGVKINRGEPIYNTAEYGTAVREELQKTTPVEMTVEAVYDADTRNVDIHVSATTSKSVDGKLQVWVIENNVVGQQRMPGDIMDSEYVHQHVFRTSVTNDIFGDDFNVTDAEGKAASYQVTLDNAWASENVAIIAFMSNDADGVLQVVKAELTAKEQ